MRRVWLIILSVLLISGLVGGISTYALFHSTATNNDNQLTAGTFTLEGNRDMGETVPGPLFYPTDLDGDLATGLWCPGDSYIRNFQVENTGTINGKLTNIKATLNGDTQLADRLNVQVSTENPDVAGFLSSSIVASGKLSDFTSNSGKQLSSEINVDVSDIANLYFKVSFPEGTAAEDNPYQGNNLSASFSVYAIQR